MLGYMHWANVGFYALDLFPKLHWPNIDRWASDQCKELTLGQYFFMVWWGERGLSKMINTLRSQTIWRQLQHIWIGLRGTEDCYLTETCTSSSRTASTSSERNHRPDYRWLQNSNKLRSGLMFVHEWLTNTRVTLWYGCEFLAVGMQLGLRVRSSKSVRRSWSASDWHCNQGMAQDCIAADGRHFKHTFNIRPTHISWNALQLITIWVRADKAIRCSGKRSERF